MKILRYSSRGPSVQLLQLALCRAGYGPLERDGVFGARTREALQRFQRSHGLSADGVAGERTHASLMPWYTGFLRRRLRPGDSFYSLASQYGVDVAAIELANPGLEPERLAAGSFVTVPLPFDVVPTDIDYTSALCAFCVRGLSARYPFIGAGHSGRSVMGRPLWRMTFGYGQRRVLYAGAFHANEWITSPLLLKYTEELAAAFARGGAVFGRSAAELLENTTFCVVPMVDPDGVDLVTGELDSGPRYARALEIFAAKPDLPFPSGWKANIAGTDLNLQFPALWEQAREIKAAAGVTGPAPADYVGPSPLSAPESRAMYDLARSFSPALVLAYHTQGEVIYWRFGRLEPEGSAELAAAFAAVSGYAPAEVPLSASFAGYKDWFIQDYMRPGFTIEAGRGKNPLPISDFDAIYAANRGILTLAAAGV